MLAASGWPKMPKTPHSSLNLSMHALRRPLTTQATRFAKYRSIAVDHTRSASLDRHVDSDVGRRRRSAARLPPVSPMTRAGTPAAAARCKHLGHVHRATPRRPRATPIRRTAPPPRSIRGVARHARRASMRHLGADAAGVEAALGERRPRGRRPNSRAPIESAARRPASTSRSCSARSAVEIERRRHAAHEAVHDLRGIRCRPARRGPRRAGRSTSPDRLETAGRARDRRARAARRRR